MEEENGTNLPKQCFEVDVEKMKVLEQQKMDQLTNWNTLRLETYTCEAALSKKFSEFLKSLESKDKLEKTFGSYDILILYLKVLLYKFVPSKGAAENIFTNYLSENASPRFEQFPTGKLQIIQDHVKKNMSSTSLYDELLAEVSNILYNRYLPIFFKSEQFSAYKKGLFERKFICLKN